MKNSLKHSFCLFLIAALAYSCQDSLGIEDNVNIIKEDAINKEYLIDAFAVDTNNGSTGDNNRGDSILNSVNIDVDIFELHNRQSFLDSLGYKNRIIKASARLDTSSKPYKIDLTIRINNEPINILPPRNFYIRQLEFNLDWVEWTPFTQLDGNSDSLIYAQMVVASLPLPSSIFYTYFKDELFPTVLFRATYKKNPLITTYVLDIDIPFLPKHNFAERAALRTTIFIDFQI